jgi:hypothetical protein
MTTQYHSIFQQSYPEWIAARAIVRAHAEASWDQMLCGFSGSEIIYRPANVVAFDGLETTDVVALTILGEIDFHDEGTALMQHLYDFSAVPQIRALLGANVKIDCLIVADLEIKSPETLEEIKTYTESNPNEFYQTLKKVEGTAD